MKGVTFSRELYRSVINPEKARNFKSKRWADARDLDRTNYQTRERLYDEIYMAAMITINLVQDDVERKFDAWNYEQSA